jgi:hypothetical protein
MRWTGPSTIAAAALVAGVLGVASHARADPPPDAPEVFYPPPRIQVFADLTFVLDPKAVPICRVNGGALPMTAEGLFKLLAGARVGDAFEPNPRSVHVGRVRVEVLKIPGGVAGSYVWERLDGTLETRRVVEHGVTPLHCKEVLERLAIDIALGFNWIEMQLGAKYAHQDAPPAPAPPPPAPTCPACISPSRFDLWPRELPLPPLHAPEPDPPKPRERWPVAFRIGAGAWADLISTDRGSLGLAVDAGVRLGWFSVNGEARWDPALGSIVVDDYGQVSFGRVTGALLLCGHVGWFVGCGVGSAGRLLFTGTIPPQPAQTYAAVGVRLGGDVLIPIDPVSITTDTQTVFQVNGWNAGIGLGALFEIGKR